MATLPNANAANASSNAEKTALVDAANQAFIDGATLAINTAISQGKFTIFINSIPRMDPKFITSYFQGLGYTIALPNLNNPRNQPALLFGEFWEDFWADESWVDEFMPFSFLPFFNQHQPYQVKITWTQPL